MRRLFLVLAKLVGLLQVYWAFVNFMQIGFAISMMIRSEPTEVGQVLSGLIGVVLYFSLSLGMAWLLLARTDWIADKLKIRDEGESAVPPDDVILRTGVKLIGLYVTVYAIPGFAKAILESRLFIAWQVGIHFWTKILPAAIQLAIGLFFTFKSSKVLEWITRDKEMPEQQVGQVSSEAAPSASPDEPST